MHIQPITFPARVNFLKLVWLVILVLAAMPGSERAAAQPERSASLSTESKRRFNTLMVIMGEADAAKKADERQRLLNEFLERSRSFVEANPSHTEVWLMRAVAATELNLAGEGVEAAHKLLELKADELDDPKAKKIMAALDRKGWLDGEAPAPNHVEVEVVARVEPGAITRENPLVNSLGMKFVSVPGAGPLFSIWLTRVQDYAAFADANSGVDHAWRDPKVQGVAVTPGLTHPVVNVNWSDAQGFCRWLTKKEQREGKIPLTAHYRLPKDSEWSRAVGLANREGTGTPRQRSGRLPSVYPWGTQWPPPSDAGNFSDQSAGAAFADWETIGGYRDGFATTSPVGSFKENHYGLFDMSGNAWEWCDDWYDNQHKYRVTRGGSWNSHGSKYLVASYRCFRLPDERIDSTGFRCVLEGLNRGEVVRH
jgi:hypothetical protein